MYIDTERHKWVNVHRMPWKCLAASGCKPGVSFVFETDTGKCKAFGQQGINRKR
jgi:hypothetical protein